jgi:hypothetical protein
MAPGATVLLILCAAAAVNAVKPENMIATDGKIEVIDGKHIQEITREFPFEPGQSFQLSNSNGSINVEGWDEDKVLITAEKRLEKRVGAVGWIMNKLNIDYKTSGDMEDYFEEVDVEVGLTEGGVVVDTIKPKDTRNFNVAVYYSVKLPRQTDVVLKTSNGRINIEAIDGTVGLRSSNGRIEAEHINGAAEARTSNGRIEFTNITGPIETRTSNGSIAIESPQPLAAGNSIKCETSNGSVRLELAHASAFDLEARTSNGRIRTNFDVDRTDGGDSKRRINGTVNGGGPLLDLTTTNGSISIDSDRD